VFCYLFFFKNEKLEVIPLLILLFREINNGELLPPTSLTSQENHLVRSLRNISHRYFTPGRTLVISSPAKYRDLQQELIAEFRRSSIWPAVVTVDGNISKPKQTEFIDRDGNYIILLPDGNLKRFEAEINGVAEDGTFSQDYGILKFGLLLLQQMNSQYRNKWIYLFVSQNLEYITVLLYAKSIM